jgi:hypothetical protein
MTADQKKFVEMMQNPEVREALGGSDDKELEALLETLEVGEEDTLESVAKKSDAKIAKLIKYFNGKVAKAESNAVEEATKDTRKKEDAKIAKFSASNPGMNNPEVVALMQPLYDNGKPLDECYAAACKGLDLDPITGELPKGDDKGEEKKGEDANDKDEGKGAKQSLKSGIGEEADVDTDEGEDKGKDTPISLDDALQAASASYIAKNGDPFATKE